MLKEAKKHKYKNEISGLIKWIRNYTNLPPVRVPKKDAIKS